MPKHDISNIPQLDISWLDNYCAMLTTEARIAEQPSTTKKLLTSKLFLSTFALATIGASYFFYRQTALNTNEVQSNQASSNQDLNSIIQSIPTKLISAIQHYAQAITNARPTLPKTQSTITSAPKKPQTANAETQTDITGFIAPPTSPLDGTNLPFSFPLSESYAEKNQNAQSEQQNQKTPSLSRADSTSSNGSSEVSKLSSYDDTDHHLQAQAPLPEDNNKTQKKVENITESIHPSLLSTIIPWGLFNRQSTTAASAAVSAAQKTEAPQQRL